MPGNNGTGPMGMGPMTGRGLGPCGNGTRRGGGGRGFFGRGFRRFWTKTDEKAALEEEEKMLAEELAQVKKERAALGDQK